MRSLEAIQIQHNPAQLFLKAKQKNRPRNLSISAPLILLDIPRSGGIRSASHLCSSRSYIVLSAAERRQSTMHEP
ncbi:hypothetical protein J6590_065832 [Homalodisca vitripennis]|nr:hypothetical protein J6590_065832 [Homalodisca vitripennis]